MIVLQTLRKEVLSLSNGNQVNCNDKQETTPLGCLNNRKRFINMSQQNFFLFFSYAEHRSCIRTVPSPVKFMNAVASR